MHRTVVVNVVGLTPALVPYLKSLQHYVEVKRPVAIRPPLPAVTCTVQATYLTGTYPDQHGIVGNGWYFRDTCEVRLWQQSNKLVLQPKIWERARQIDPGFTCANLFWWFNMYSSADVTVTPRPMYPADGRKIPDLYTHPAELRERLQEMLGPFPLFNFWGPAADHQSSRWIAYAAMEVDRAFNSTLTLVYLPHLDYCLQRHGPDLSKIGDELSLVDRELDRVLAHFRASGARVIVLSEYGITAVEKPVHINRALRDAGFLCVRNELGRELLDAGASVAFAVADHQVAHVYVNDRSRIDDVRSTLEQVGGIDAVFGIDEQKALHLNHARSGELVALARPNAFFTYYYWLDDRRAPDFARTVDIHRKPGYDPAELFLDPTIRFPRFHIGWKLLRRGLGLRTLMDVVPLDARLVRGSHGLPPSTSEEGPVLLTSEPGLIKSDQCDAPDVYHIILDHLFGGA